MKKKNIIINQRIKQIIKRNILKYILILSLILNYIEDYLFNNIKYFQTNKSSLKIFIMAHKDFENFRYNPVYSIVVDDKSFLKNKYNLDIIYADQGKLYKLKRAYSEMSQLYYIYTLYKQGKITSDYIGLNHYRRYFNFTDNIPDLDEIFKNYDAILNIPYLMRNGMRNQYCLYHKCKNYDQVIEIIKDIKPEYYKSALETMNLKNVNICNLFIMKKKDFFKYCEFMFDVLFEFDRRNNFTSDEDVLHYITKFHKINGTKYINSDLYQSRIQAFLSERIGNIFYYKNFKKVKLFNYGNYRKESKLKSYSSYSKFSKNNNKFKVKLIIKNINFICLLMICFLIFVCRLNIIKK